MSSLSEPTRATGHHTGSLYGAFAFCVVALACFAGYFTNVRFYRGPALVPVPFALGAFYCASGILGGHWFSARGAWAKHLYYVVQCLVLTLILTLSPLRGFFGVLVLPLASQAIFDYRRWGAAVVTLYLYFLDLIIWYWPYGWDGVAQAVLSYAAGFAFTIAFTLITRRALDARDREEKLRLELETANAQLRAHATQTAELATMRERNRLAREIHDGVGHYLTVVKTQLDAAAALVETQPTRARETLAKAARLTHDALADVRRSVGALRADTARPPLPEAVRQLATLGAPVPSVVIEGAPRPLPPAVEHALFRAAQEGLTNIRKHARASSSLLRVDFREPQRVRLELSDNGIGADAPAGPGFGLTGIRERVELLGGKVESGNRAGGGFALLVEVPA